MFDNEFVNGFVVGIAILPAGVALYVAVSWAMYRARRWVFGQLIGRYF